MGDDFKALLEGQHSFPGPYTFKFIVPSEAKEQVTTLVSGDKVEQRPSRNGKYISFSVTAEMQSADEVLSVYDRARQIPGIISL